MIFPKLNVKIDFKIVFLFGILGASILLVTVYLGFNFIPYKITEKIWEKKVLKENTEQWNMFMKMPFPFDFKVFLFDIVNPKEILLGAKPIVREKGPYVYQLHRWKNEVAWNYTTGEISYYQYEKYLFDQKASGNLTEDDLVTVLNVPYNSFLLTAELLSPNFLPLIDPTLPIVFGENDGLFLTTKVKDFLFDGIKICQDYGENGGFAAKAICSQIKLKASEAKQMRIEKDSLYFSNFEFKNNTHQGYFTVNSGLGNRKDVSQLVYFENKTQISTWNDQNSSCNEIGGVTTVFPAYIDKSLIFGSFSEDICRTVKMKFTTVETIQDIRSYRFEALNTTFSGSKSLKENECFCLNTTMNFDGNFDCLFDGVTDLTQCKVVMARFLENQGVSTPWGALVFLWKPLQTIIIERSTP